MNKKCFLYYILNILIFIMIFNNDDVKCQTKINAMKQYAENNCKTEIFISEDYLFLDGKYGLNYPSMVRIGANNDVVVLDKGDHCLYVFSQEGKFIRKIGQPGQGPGDLLVPQTFCIDEEGNIYVYEYDNRRITIFTKEGKYLNSFRTKHIFAMSVTDNKRIIVSSPERGFYITVYSQKGEVEKEIGKVEEYFSIKQLNIEHSEGFPFYTEDNKYYIFMISLKDAIVIIYNSDGKEVERKYLRLLNIPEVIEQETFVDEKSRSSKDLYKSGRWGWAYIFGVVYKSKYFYLSFKSYKKEDLYKDNIFLYKINKNIDKIEEKKVILLESRPKDFIGRTDIKDIPKINELDITNNGEIIYIPVFYTNNIIKAFVKE